MAYRFKLDEPLQMGFRRICAEQIDRALAELRSADDPGQAVHSARKSIKRLRAVLRLVRPALGDKSFANENARLRDTAALLSSARDAEILLETATKLASFDPRIENRSMNKLKSLLATHFAQLDRTGESVARAEAARRLEAARTRFSRIKLSPDDFDSVWRGLEQNMRHSKTAFEAAYSDPTDEAFHDWRKSVQRHWRHMAVLSRAWPDLAEARVTAARRLSQILGDDHDLAVLKLYIAQSAPNGLTKIDCRDIAMRAVRSQNELRALAHPLGVRLLAESANGIGRRFAIYWKAAKEMRAAEAGGTDADVE